MTLPRRHKGLATNGLGLGTSSARWEAAGVAVRVFSSRHVAAKTQGTCYKRVRVGYVVRSVGSCWRCSACLFFRHVAAKTQGTCYKRVRVGYVVRSVGSCWRCSACLFFLVFSSFLPAVRVFSSFSSFLPAVRVFSSSCSACLFFLFFLFFLFLPVFSSY